MKKTILLAFAILMGATAFCGNEKNAPVSAGHVKINLKKKPVPATAAKDLCVVSVNQPKSGMVEASPGNYVQISVLGSCTKSGESCEAAFIAANSCATSDRDAKYAAAEAAAKKSTLEAAM
jgi:hypothetical protein